MTDLVGWKRRIDAEIGENCFLSSHLPQSRPSHLGGKRVAMVSNARVGIGPAKTTMGMDRSTKHDGKLSVDPGRWNEGVVTTDWLLDCEPVELPLEGTAKHRGIDAGGPEALMEDYPMHRPVLH